MGADSFFPCLSFTDRFTVSHTIDCGHGIEREDFYPIATMARWSQLANNSHAITRVGGYLFTCHVSEGYRRWDTQMQTAALGLNVFPADANMYMTHVPNDAPNPGKTDRVAIASMHMMVTRDMYWRSFTKRGVRVLQHPSDFFCCCFSRRFRRRRGCHATM
jgi:hypothetical protein